MSSIIDFATFDTGWVKLTSASGISDSGSNTNGLWARNTNGTITLWGMVKKASGNFSQGDIITTLPDNLMPYFAPGYENDNLPIPCVITGSQLTRCNIFANNGNITYGSSVASSWAFIYGVYMAKM